MVLSTHKIRMRILWLHPNMKTSQKELYLSAMVEYMQASSRLIEAEIRLKKAKTESYEAYKVVIALGLEKQIKNKINFCKRQMHYLKWRK